MFRTIVAAAFLAAVAATSQAKDMALVIANHKYDSLANSGTDRAINRAVRALSNAGFSVDQFRNMDARQLQIAAEGFARRIGENTDRLVIVVSGHMVSGETDSWVLGRQALVPSSLTIGAQGVSLAALSDILADRPGQALLVVAAGDYDARTGRGLRAGDTASAVPQGVTRISGPADRVIGHLTEDFLRPGRTLADLRDDLSSGVRMDGFVSDRVSFTPEVTAVAPPAVVSGDQAYWNAVRDIGSADALRAYLRRYPDGDFASAAREAIRDLEEAPLRRAEEDENALNLSRNARRDVQRHLTLLGHDTRGVDGVLGRGSRAAIRDWQRSRGLDVTGYLNRVQLDLLRESARLRQAELDAQERRAREAREREDRDYWQQIGSGRDEAGLRAYLSRYPNGVFAEVARDRLSRYDQARQDEQDALDRQSWANAENGNNLETYRGYLDRFPNGLFAEEAKRRIARLDRDAVSDEQIAAARAEEKRVASSVLNRALAEGRLAQLGYDPGKQDGRFTDKTRAALRQYQKDRKLLVTGYLDQRTVNSLLSGR